MIAALERTLGHHAGGNDLPLRVHVGHEAVESADALRQATRERRPLVVCDQARHRIQRERLRHAVVHEADTALGRLVSYRLGQCLEIQPGEGPDELGIGGTHAAVGFEGLVEDLRGRLVAHSLRMDIGGRAVLVPPSKDP